MARCGGAFDSGKCCHFGHPDKAVPFPKQTTPVLHMQRRPGETFPELHKRLGMEAK